MFHKVDVCVWLDANKGGGGRGENLLNGCQCCFQFCVHVAFSCHGCSHQKKIVHCAVLKQSRRMERSAACSPFPRSLANLATSPVALVVTLVMLLTTKPSFLVVPESVASGTPSSSICLTSQQQAFVHHAFIMYLNNLCHMTINYLYVFIGMFLVLPDPKLMHIITITCIKMLI